MIKYISWLLSLHFSLKKFLKYQHILPKTFFRNKNIEEITEMSFNATKMLDVWSAEYLETRRSIEKSKFQRWEFDKCVLFNKIEYIKRIAKDIHEIVVVSILALQLTYINIIFLHL